MKNLLSSILLALVMLFPTVTYGRGRGSSRSSRSSGYSRTSYSHSSRTKTYTYKSATYYTPKASKAKAASPSVAPAVTKHKSTYSKNAQRDSNGKIKRSEKAKDDFKKANPCPATGKGSGACPGYVIDHVVALKRGGADSPSNMQWQTEAAAKAKDKVE